MTFCRTKSVWRQMPPHPPPVHLPNMHLQPQMPLLVLYNLNIDFWVVNFGTKRQNWVQKSKYSFK